VTTLRPEQRNAAAAEAEALIREARRRQRRRYAVIGTGVVVIAAVLAGTLAGFSSGPGRPGQRYRHHPAAVSQPARLDQSTPVIKGIGSETKRQRRAARFRKTRMDLRCMTGP
jgi:hypothetical protein